MRKVTLKKDLSVMKPFEIENYILSVLKATPTEKNTVGIDGIIANNGWKVEVKGFGKNRPSLGAIDIEKGLMENIDNLLVSDLYALALVKTNTLHLMSKDEMTDWLIERVIFDRDRHKNPKFKISWNIRSKKQDLRLIEQGQE